MSGPGSDAGSDAGSESEEGEPGPQEGGEERSLMGRTWTMRSTTLRNWRRRRDTSARKKSVVSDSSSTKLVCIDRRKW